MVLMIAVILGVGFTFAVRYLAAANEARAEAEFPPEGDFVDVGGTAVHYVQRGTGPDVVLIHGAGGFTREFTFDFVDRLTDRYRVTVFDRPGLGYTERPRDFGVFSRDMETPREQARLLQDASAALGVDRPIVLGHSFGGAVALAWALERPESIAGIVMDGGVSNEWEGGVGGFYNNTAAPLGGALVVPMLTAFATDAYIANTIQAIFRPQPVPEGYTDYIGARISARRETLRANGRQVHGLKPHIVEMVPHYGGIDIPVEIIHGDQDTIVPLDVHSIPLSKQIPGANLVVLEGVGHMPHHAAPDVVVAAIDRAAASAGLR